MALRLDLGQALFLSGDLSAAGETARDAAARAAAARDEVGELRARLLGARIAAQTPSEDSDGGGPGADLLAIAEEARSVFARAGDELGLAEAWFATAWAELIRCRWAAMLEAAGYALEHARRGGSARWEGELPAWQGTAMFYGPTPADEALRWYEEQHAQHPISLTQQATLEAMRGNFDLARTLAASADAAAAEFGQKLWLAAGGMALWEIEMLAGDLSAAERAVRRSCELLEELGEVGHRSLAAGQLAASLYASRVSTRPTSGRRPPRGSRRGDVVVPDALATGPGSRSSLVAATTRRPRRSPARRWSSRGKRTCSTTTRTPLPTSAEIYVAAGRAEEGRTHLEQALSPLRAEGQSRRGRARRPATRGAQRRTARLLRQRPALLGSRGPAPRRRINGQARSNIEKLTQRATRSRPRNPQGIR